MKKIKVLVISLVLCLTVMVQPVLAEGGKGSGGGNGGGKDLPLVVESTSPTENGILESEKDIVVTFSKNVANESVKDVNASLFELQSKDGQKVAFTVEIPDEQVEPDRRNDIVIKPESKLKDGMYTLTIKAGITAKSGDVLAEDYVLNFNAGSGVVKETKEEPEVKVEKKTNYVPYVIGGLVVVGLIVFAVSKKKKD